MLGIYINYCRRSWSFLGIWNLNINHMCRFLGEGGGYNLFGGFEVVGTFFSLRLSLPLSTIAQQSCSQECKTASNQIWHISHDHTQWEQVPVVGNVPPARGGTVATSHGSYGTTVYLPVFSYLNYCPPFKTTVYYRLRQSCQFVSSSESLFSTHTLLQSQILSCMVEWMPQSTMSLRPLSMRPFSMTSGFTLRTIKHRNSSLMLRKCQLNYLQPFSAPCRNNLKRRRQH